MSPEVGDLFFVGGFYLSPTPSRGFFFQTFNFWFFVSALFVSVPRPPTPLLPSYESYISLSVSGSLRVFLSRRFFPIVSFTVSGDVCLFILSSPTASLLLAREGACLHRRRRRRNDKVRGVGQWVCVDVLGFRLNRKQSRYLPQEIPIKGPFTCL